MSADPRPPPERPANTGVRFDAVINLGAVLQAGIIICGLVTWLVTGNNRSENAAIGITTLQQSVAKDMAALQVTLTGQNTDLRRDLQELRQQIITLPDQRARLDQVEHWRADVEARFVQMDNRTSQIERTAIESRSDLSGLLRGANIALPKRQ